MPRTWSAAAVTALSQRLVSVQVRWAAAEYQSETATASRKMAATAAKPTASLRPRLQALTFSETRVPMRVRERLRSGALTSGSTHELVVDVLPRRHLLGQVEHELVAAHDPGVDAEQRALADLGRQLLDRRGDRDRVVV